MRTYIYGNRIFQRAGIPEVVTVASDSRYDGWKPSLRVYASDTRLRIHCEFCNECDCANMGRAKTIVENQPGQAEDLECIETPDCKTIGRCLQIFEE